jgi:hypothetical protein
VTPLTRRSRQIGWGASDDAGRGLNEHLPARQARVEEPYLTEEHAAWSHAPFHLHRSHPTRHTRRMNTPAASHADKCHRCPSEVISPGVGLWPPEAEP